MDKRTITFDPIPHTYTDEYGKKYTSVTTLISKVEPKYPVEFWAMYRAVDQVGVYKPRPFLATDEIEINFRGRRKKFSIKVLYSGIVPLNKTPDEIRAEWEETTKLACDWGTDKHNYLENCINKFSATNKIKIHDIREKSNTLGFSYKVTSIQELEESPLKFTYPTIYKELEKKVKAGWVIYAEKRVYNSKYLVAGTIDVLLVKGKKFIILDWKTNKDPLQWKSGYYKKVWNTERTKKYKTSQFINRKEYFKFPLNKLAYCKGNVYTLQLSMYDYLSELWGLEYVGNVLCHIRPYVTKEGEIVYEEDGITRKEHKPEFHKITYRKKEVKRLLDWHSGQMLRFKQPSLSL